jgi:PHD/YefM family antitoxin component YafN of YafNO toxin-antitoxin module
MMETLHLLGSAANAERLFKGASELDEGRGTERDPTV